MSLQASEWGTAKQVGLSYAFAPCYLSLVKGSGVEAETHRNVTPGSAALHP